MKNRCNQDFLFFVPAFLKSCLVMFQHLPTLLWTLRGSVRALTAQVTISFISFISFIFFQKNKGNPLFLSVGYFLFLVQRKKNPRLNKSKLTKPKRKSFFSTWDFFSLNQEIKEILFSTWHFFLLSIEAVPLGRVN